MNKQYLDKNGLETLWGKIKAYTVFVKGDADNSAVLKGGNNVASSSNSSAFGLETNASGEASHAEGFATITYNEAEHASGKYNNSVKKTESNTSADATLFSIGIGDSNNQRKNAYEVKQNGDIYVKGVGGYDGTNSDDSYDLATYLPNMVNITYDELVALRSDSKLVPGQQYRITDYVTTTTQENTQSAGHQFDLIVIADSESTLNETARAIQHDGDTYFADSDLNAWQIWYCLDNDTTRFAWADTTNGKGVIYRMIDEFGNDCPYDFKNIRFEHPNDATAYPDYYYTFSTVIDGVVTDHSMLHGYCFNNIIKEYIETIQQLNRNVFINTNEDSYCYSNIFGNFCVFNSFGNGCHSNSFGIYCVNNSFGNGCLSNSFGNYCYSNSFGNNYHYNSFGNYCHSNSFGKECYHNSFGNNCSSNSFGDNCYSNSFGNDCGANSFGDNCYGNSFGNDCSENSFGNYCHSNSFRNECRYNSFRKSNSKDADLRDYCYYNHFDDGCSYNVIWNTDIANALYKLQNINVNRGVVGIHTSFNMINIDILNSEQEINVNQVDGIISIGNILSITYESLKTLRDNAQLIPGQQYRITDYVTTTVDMYTQAENHQFDIIVTADNESTLNETARAIQHDGDDYFTNSDLNVWKIWYCLDNDTNRFAWADTGNGKGVIYRMIDEFGNDCPYDFKNIRFEHPNDTSTYYNYYYTFSTVTDDSVKDHSMLQGHCFNNIIKEYIETIQQLNRNVFINTYEESYCYSNSFGNNCYNNSFGNGCFNNSFANGCFNNSFGDICYNNSFENNCYSNSFGDNCSTNSFGNECYSNSFGNECYFNSFRNGCNSNSFGDGCNSNSFGNYCYSNSFGGYCYNNSFGNNCYNNSFEEYCSSNSFGNDCHDNNFEYEYSFNSFGSNCFNNSFGYFCYSNSFGNNCRHNSFGNECTANSFGNECRYNSFRNSNSKDAALRDYCSYNHFDDGCSYNVIWNTTTASSSYKIQNININRGTSGTSSSYNMINIDVLNSIHEIEVYNDSTGKTYIDSAPIALTTTDIDLIWGSYFIESGYGSASAVAAEESINSVGIGDYDENIIE